MIMEKLMKYYYMGRRDRLLLKNKLTELYSSSTNSSLHPEPEIKSWASYLESYQESFWTPQETYKNVFSLREISFIEYFDRINRRINLLLPMLQIIKRVRRLVHHRQPSI